MAALLSIGERELCLKNAADDTLQNIVPTVDNNVTSPPNGVMIPQSSENGPPPSEMQIVYIRQGGDDINGDGTLIQPYATITYAMSAIIDATSDKRYLLDVGPANWPDNFQWKNWVFMRGAHAFATCLAGTVGIDDPSWAVGPTNQCAGARDIGFVGMLTLDFTLQSAQYGKFYFINCNINLLLTINAQGPANQVIAYNGLWSGGVTVNGGQLLMVGATSQSGNITLNSSSVALTFTAYGGAFIGSLIMNANNPANVGVTANLYGSPFISAVSPGITINGSQAILNATNNSLPTVGFMNIVNGGILNYLTDIASLAYTPTVPGYWNGNPTSAQDAIDRMASLLFTLNSGRNIP